jgi:hypothetical protein
MIEIVLGKVAAPGFVSACGVPMRGSRNSDPPKWFRRHEKKPRPVAGAFGIQVVWISSSG